MLMVTGVGAIAQSTEQSQPPAEAKPPEETPTQAAPPLVSPEERAAMQQIEETGKVNLEQALTLVEEFLTKYPQSPLRSRAYAAGSAAQRGLGRLPQAIEYAEKGLELAPEDAFLIIQLADALVESANPREPGFRGKLDRSETYARRALELLPPLLSSMPQRPEIPPEEYTRQQNYVQSLPHSILGTVAFKRGQYSQAIEEFKQSTDLNPSNPDDFLRMGESQRLARDWAGAKASFERCLTLSQPGTPLAEFAQRRLQVVEKNLAEHPVPDEPKPQE
jgi:tetratricopeptide (TPR) repeat protein